MTLNTTKLLLPNLLWQLIVACLLSIAAYDAYQSIFIVAACFAPVIIFSIIFRLLLNPVVKNKEANAKIFAYVLNLPSQVSRVAAYLWFVVALVYVAIYWEADKFYIIYGTLLIITAGSVSATFGFYTTEQQLRKSYIPELAENIDINSLDHSPVNIRFKLFILFSTSGLLPVVALMISASLGSSPSQLFYIGGAFLIIGIWQVFFISNSVNTPLVELSKAMNTVGKGELNIETPIRSLDEIGQLSDGFNTMTKNLVQAEFVKNTFGRYVTQQVMDEILQGNIKLGGQMRQATILFSDIRGFTSLSEKMDARDVVSILNDYLDMMVEVIIEQGGTIDKFIGDAIMATFGAPDSSKDDAIRAVHAAVNMQTKLTAWNKTRIAQGKFPLNTGIGIHSGPVVAGNIGSEKKMEYTVIGDTVNTASRIEQLTKNYESAILISEQTYKLLSDEFKVEALPPIEVKGKEIPLNLYRIIVDDS